MQVSFTSSHHVEEAISHDIGGCDSHMTGVEFLKCFDHGNESERPRNEGSASSSLQASEQSQVSQNLDQDDSSAKSESTTAASSTTSAGIDRSGQVNSAAGATVPLHVAAAIMRPYPSHGPDPMAMDFANAAAERRASAGILAHTPHFAHPSSTGGLTPGPGAGAGHSTMLSSQSHPLAQQPVPISQVRMEGWAQGKWD
jgi:hypothetical protein